jgi:hypothetical protein
MTQAAGAIRHKLPVALVAGASSAQCSDVWSTAADEEPAGVPPVTNMPGSAVSPVLTSYLVGRVISLPFGRSLPKCNGFFFFFFLSPLLCASGNIVPCSTSRICIVLCVCNDMDEGFNNLVCNGYRCNCNALIAYHGYSDTARDGVLCLDPHPSKTIGILSYAHA